MSKIKNLIYSLCAQFQYRTDSSQYIYRLQSHRGYCQDPEIRENTLAAIQQSHQLKYQMVEFDVRLTKDQHVILFHDDHYEGRKISKLNLSELKEKIHIDLLDEVFNWYRSIDQNKFKLNIEIKSKVVNGKLEKHVFELIQKHQMQKNILISSFNPISLAHFYKMDATIFRSLLLSNEKEHGNNFFIKNMTLNFLAKPNALHLRKEDWSLQVFRKILKFNIPIVLWTCNDILNVETYFNEGITGLISDTIRPTDLKQLS